MGRTSLRNSKVITFALLLAGLWAVVVAVDVVGMVQRAFGGGETVGQTAFSGLVGLVVIAVFLGLTVVLYGELSETEPTPSTWPPE